MFGLKIFHSTDSELLEKKVSNYLNEAIRMAVENNTTMRIDTKYCVSGASIYAFIELDTLPREEEEDE